MITKNNLQKEFINRWKEKCSKIEKLELSTYQAQRIFDSYLNELKFNNYRKKTSEEEIKRELFMYEYSELMTDLQLALFQAMNNYNERFPSFFNKFKSLKIKNFEYHNK